MYYRNKNSPFSAKIMTNPNNNSTLSLSNNKKRPNTAPNHRPLSPGINGIIKFFNLLKAKSDSPYNLYNVSNAKKTVVKDPKNNKVRMRSMSPGQQLQQQQHKQELQQQRLAYRDRENMTIGNSIIAHRGISPNKPKWKF